MTSLAGAPAPAPTSLPLPPGSANHIGGVPLEIGQLVHVNTKKQLQRQINAIVGWNETDRAPMTIGQSLLRANEPQVAEHPYFVCEKSVGVRYLALLVQGRCYLISQNYDIREVVLFCPVRPDRLQPGVDRNTIVPHQWTILDGLLVCDKDGSKSVLAFLVYDILALNGSPVMSSKLQDRLKLIQNDVIGPRKTIPPPKGQPPDMFQLVLQSMYPINRVSHVIRTIIPRVSQTRQNAGLVFTPVALPYSPGYTKGLFYWTQPSLLYVDFQLGVEWRGRPPKPGFKLMVHDKRTPVFHDWITFSPEDFEFFRQDKKASSRIIDCSFDPEWLTYVPSHDKSTWDIGNPEFNATERGQGWRKGGWRFVRCRNDKAMPLERAFLGVTEKAVSEDVKLEEIEQFFTEDASKKPMRQEKARQEIVPSQDNHELIASKKKRGGGGQGIGVCYDFQNKGVCQRGRFCHFSHCACNSTCCCTPAKNTYGQRPAYRRNDYDAPPSPDTPPPAAGELTAPEKPPARPDVFEREQKAEAAPQEEEAGELTDTSNLHVGAVYAPLESFDKETIAAKRAQLAALGNRRIWTSLGLEDKLQRKRVCYKDLLSRIDNKPEAFSVTSAAKDLEYLTTTLVTSAETYVYGASYGTYWASRLMHLTPKAVKGYNLDGVVAEESEMFTVVNSENNRQVLDDKFVSFVDNLDNAKAGDNDTDAIGSPDLTFLQAVSGFADTKNATTSKGNSAVNVDKVSVLSPVMQMVIDLSEMCTHPSPTVAQLNANADVELSCLYIGSHNERACKDKAVDGARKFFENAPKFSYKPDQYHKRAATIPDGAGVLLINGGSRLQTSPTYGKRQFNDIKGKNKALVEFMHGGHCAGISSEACGPQIIASCVQQGGRIACRFVVSGHGAGGAVRQQRGVLRE
ncbi:TPA: hypothetical protein N0F65_011427 [Lagenidium giganteum]|uniref:C3H1-type domain-containing protein n=1 Tax=Lagenidium giganteum TaxID=4803 RepID=A0AAV2ZB25_9STRA|nr:TPA: hypothetical protein N0F65_011427 [Lagenidium giganteum]